MQERVEFLGGTCTITSAFGHGTTVSVQFPLAALQEYDEESEVQTDEEEGK